MKVTYLQHSGFAVEYKDKVLIFDYFKGELPETGEGKRMYVFASHAHQDHFQKKIFRIADTYPDVTYILSSDISVTDQDRRVVSVKARKDYTVDGIRIRTLRSTDEGVAFLVQLYDKTVYHAGDLNWWHWEEEGPVYNEMMRRKYQHEIGKIEEVHIDAAFVPLDPRQEEQYYWGMDYYMKHTDTVVVFPMHMWEQYDVYDRLMACKDAEGYKEKVMHIRSEGQTFEI